MTLLALGINHKTAPVSLRERVSFSPDKLDQALDSLLAQPMVQGGVVLSGHTDVVPVDGQPWSSDPFTLTQRGERLYGRGSCDMKGFIAVALALVPEFLAMPRRQPLHLALSYDEEVGCMGAPVMIDALVRRGARFDGCVVSPRPCRWWWRTRASICTAAGCMGGRRIPRSRRAAATPSSTRRG